MIWQPVFMYHRVASSLLNFKKPWPWLLLGMLVYTLAGFLLAPYLLKQQLIEFSETTVGRELQIAEVRINPFLLDVRLEGVTLLDEDQTRLVSLHQLYANLQLSSLFNRAWTLKEFSLVRPYVLYERFTMTDSRLSRLLENFAGPEATSSAAAVDSEGAMPRFILHRLVISEGQLQVMDHVPQELSAVLFSPIDIAINDLNNLPERNGSQDVKIKLPEGGAIGWQGELSLFPLSSTGRFSISDVNPGLALPYLKELLHLDTLRAFVSASFEYSLDETSRGELDLEVSDLSLQVEGFKASAAQSQRELAAIPEMSITGGRLRLLDRVVHLDQVRVTEPALSLWTSAGGELNVSGLMKPSDQGAKAPGSDPWQFSFDRFEMLGGEIEIEDGRNDFFMPVQVPRLALRDFNQSLANRFPVEIELGVGGGKADFQGTALLDDESDVSGQLSLESLPLSGFSPYLAALMNAGIKQGSLTMDLALAVHQSGDFSADGALAIDDLEMIDGIEGQRLLAWQVLAVDRFELRPESYQVSDVSLQSPYLRFAIDTEAQLNFLTLLVEQEASGSGPAAVFSAARISVADGKIDFSDDSLPLPFAAIVKAVEGSVTGISTASEKPASVALQGVVNEFGTSQVEGEIDIADLMKHTGLDVSFRNLTVANYSPYTVAFAGREIATGKLDLSLNYDIRNRQLVGNHEVVLTELTLGDKIAHPDARNLPLQLAISLLKDPDGVIDIELPVSGDVDDPEFELSDAIVKIFVNVITKAVTSPFRLLGGLVGVDSDDLGSIEFEPGEAVLAPPEREKIITLQKALKQRPALSLVVAGATDPLLDTPALKLQSLRSEVSTRLDAEFQLDSGMLDDQVAEVLEALMVERRPDQDLSFLREKHQRQDAEETLGLDMFAYLAELQDLLLEVTALPPEALTHLANARAAVIRAALLASNEGDVAVLSAMAPERIRIAAPVSLTVSSGERVHTELTVE